MPQILENREIAPRIFEMTIHHPRLAAKAQPGHFVMVMADEQGERIPLTIGDFDAAARTVTLVIMAVGTSTQKIVRRQKGESLHAIIGPLGHASLVVPNSVVVMVAGGVGTAPVFPIARAFHQAGGRVITIQGARENPLLFWTEKMASVSDTHILMTDDGSVGRKGLVTEPLREILEGKSPLPQLADITAAKLTSVYTIGPAIMMKFCAETCRPFGVHTVASLNTVMIDGTGMCGGCRVRLGEETKFTCVDGPEFDALAIDWELVLSRQKVYHEQEKCSLNRYLQD